VVARAAVVIERWARVAPLGVRCRDLVTGSSIGDLTVEAWPAAEPRRRIRAFTTAGGVYGWLDLPGLRDRGFGAGDDAHWSSLPPPLPFVVEVTDDLDRFLPVRFTAQAPARGLWRLACESGVAPPAALDAVPLHSSPARVPPSGAAVIRSEIRDSRTGGPAAWAVIEARSAGRLLGRGVSDRQGRVLLLAAYPEPLPPPLGGASVSPPGAGRIPLWEQEWPVRIDVLYGPITPGADVPDLCQVLLQPPAVAWADRGQAAPLAEVPLRYGQVLQVRTEGARGLLVVTPAASPP
jgi:hypothetical protein